MQKPKKGTVKKNGTTIVKGSRPNMGVFKSEITKTGTGLFEPYEQKTTSIDTTGYSKGKPYFTVVTKQGTGDKTSGGPKITSVSKKKIPRSQVPSTLKSLQKKKKGGAIKSKRK